MLRRLEVTNFLSWLELVYEPKEINLVIGRNNTGKSNLLKAIQFISLTSGLSLDKCAEYIGCPIHLLANHASNINEVSFRVEAHLPFNQHVGSELISYQYELVLFVPRDRTATGGLRVLREQLSMSSDRFGFAKLLGKEGDNVQLLHEGTLERENTQDFVLTTSPSDVTMLNRLYDLQTNARANLFKRYLQSWQFYDLNTKELRSYEFIPNQLVLQSEGKNLASVVSALKRRDERSYRRLVDLVQKLEPGLEYINFPIGDNAPSIFMMFDHKSGLQIPAWTMSSGTLRFMALAYVLLVQPSEPRIILIEEPETGIYVGYLRDLMDMMERNPSSNTQILLTSHSPYLIDLFDRRLDSVYITRMDKHRSSLRAVDAKTVEKHLEDLNVSLGEQYFQDLLK